MFSKLLSWIVLRTRSDTTKEIEILVLRHQLAVLQRRTPRPRMTWTDRALIAALTRLLPVRRRLGLLVTPTTILRWHRQLIARRWTTQPAQPGRPAIPAGLRALVIRLATENSTWGYADTSTASSPASATRSALPPSGPSCTQPVLTPHPGGPVRPGRSFCGRRRTRSSRATCSTSTPSPCTGSTRSSSSSTPPAACTSSVSPPTPPEPGSPSRPATSSWISTTPPAAADSSSGTATPSSRPHSTRCSPPSTSASSRHRSGHRGPTRSPNGSSAPSAANSSTAP